MNRITLKFSDKQIEESFQNSTQNKINSQFQCLIISFIAMGSFAIIMEIINKNYLTMGLYCGQLILYVGTYFYICNNKGLTSQLLNLFNKVNFLLPAVNIMYSIFDLVSFQSGINIIFMTFLYAPLFNSSYNIIQDGIQISIIIFLAVYHCSYLIGFSFNFFMLCSPIVQLMYQRYQQVKVERTLFSQSMVNQSLVDVITKICKENIIIFTYNLEQHKYQKEIINETAQSYFNTDILGEILKEIHLKNYPMQTDISSFIFRNCIQQQRRGEFQLKGYYKSKKNKILINLYVTQYENIQIILKIEEKQEKTIKIRKAKQLINFQLCFLQNLLKRFIECFRMQERIEIPQIKFYNYLHKSIIYNKLQIFSMVTSIQFIIQSINLEKMIVEVFRVWNLKHFLKLKQNGITSLNKQDENLYCNTISSSKILLELLLQLVAITIRKVIFNYDEFIQIELEYSQDVIKLNFHFTSKQLSQVSEFFKENLIKLICKLGLSEGYQFQENQISFKILKQLNEFF